MLQVYLLTNKTLIHNFLNIFEEWGAGGNLSHKNVYYHSSSKGLPKGQADPDNWSSG